jgi:hypothetical protein
VLRSTKNTSDCGIVFPKVWWTNHVPVASAAPWKWRETGSLTIGSEYAEFRSRERTMRIDNVQAISIGRRGSDIVNRWIKVTYGDEELPSNIYLNDARWLGWRALLTGSNKRIIASLRSLVGDNEP